LSATFGYSDTRRIDILGLHASDKPEGAESIYITQTTTMR